MTAVAFEEIRLTFGDAVALDGVSLEIESGELLPVLGPSGCGKTSLLRVLAGLTVPTGGRVRIGNVVVNDPAPRVPAHRRGIGMVFQQLALWPHLSVRGNLEFGLRAHGLPRAERGSRIAETLALVGLGGLDARMPNQLSGGERQRVALARALVLRPDLLLLDEPLSSVDAMLKDDILAEVRRINRQLGLTTMFVTHDRDEALAVGARVAVMGNGRLVQVGPVEALFARPANRFVASLLGGHNVFWARRGEDGRLAVITEVVGSANGPAGAVAAAIRPTDLRLIEGPGDDHPLAGTVEASIYEGAAWRIAVRAGTLGLDVAADRAWPLGARVGLEFAADPIELEQT